MGKEEMELYFAVLQFECYLFPFSGLATSEMVAETLRSWFISVTLYDALLQTTLSPEDEQTMEVAGSGKKKH